MPNDDMIPSFLFLYARSFCPPPPDKKVDRGLAQAIQQARLGKKMTQKQLATVSPVCNARSREQYTVPSQGGRRSLLVASARCPIVLCRCLFRACFLVVVVFLYM